MRENTSYVHNTEKICWLPSIMPPVTIGGFNHLENWGSQSFYGRNYRKCGKNLMTSGEVAVMDGGKFILQFRGMQLLFSNEFDITKYPCYKYLVDADKKTSLLLNGKKVDQPYNLFNLY